MRAEAAGPVVTGGSMEVFTSERDDDGPEPDFYDLSPERQWQEDDEAPSYEDD